MPDVEYRIKAGDTLGAIARRYRVTVDELADANGISNPDRIAAGQLLKVPVGAQSPLEPSPQPGSSQNTTPQGSNKTPQQSSGTTVPSGGTPAGNPVMAVAFRITGAFEGAKATSYQNKDKGIVSYGKHQATLASGTLGTILARYVKQSKSLAAQQLAGYMSKVQSKDSTLRKDAGFKQALLSAGADPLMGTIQDEVFAQTFWPPAEQGVRTDKLQSPMALVMYYDTNIQGGLTTVRSRTAAAMKGKQFTEAQYLTEFNRQRDLRLHNLAVEAREDGDTDHANMLESSRSRVTKLQELVKSGDLQLKGDRQGMLLINGSRVAGLGAVSGGGTAPQQPASSTQVKWTLAPFMSDILNKGAVIKKGMMGPAVVDLQQRLGLKPEDGKFGSDTESAVKAFHATAGVKLSPGMEGCASKATFEALKNGASQSHGIDLKKIARSVHAAMADGILQTDEHKVYVNLAKLNHDETLIKQFKSTYKSLYFVDVVTAIRSEFSNSWFYGDELTRALSYLQPQKKQPAGGNNASGKNAKSNSKPTEGGTKPAPKGTVERSGKHWVSRFMPSNKLTDLKEPFQSKVRSFFAALSAAGIKFDINTTLRPPQRSYLMYYAREVKAGRLSPDKVPAFVPQGGDAPVNIDWTHRDSSGKADLAAAKKAAVAMDSAYGAADAIGKPYKSNHNGGEAIDVDFTPGWGIGKTVVDGNGKSVKIGTKRDLIDVGATFGVLHWNYSGPKNKKDDPHWSKTGN